MKKNHLEPKNLVNIGMDGPRVNHKFHYEIIEEFGSNGNQSLIYIGTCPIHAANNAYNKLLSSLQQSIDLDAFVSDLHGWFGKSAARRIEFSQASKYTALSSKLMIKHVKTRESREGVGANDRAMKICLKKQS